MIIIILKKFSEKNYTFCIEKYYQVLSNTLKIAYILFLFKITAVICAPSVVA